MSEVHVMVGVYNFYSEQTTRFVGSAAEVCAWLLMTHPWLKTADPDRDRDLVWLVAYLNSAQAFEAWLRWGAATGADPAPEDADEGDAS